LAAYTESTLMPNSAATSAAGRAAVTHSQNAFQVVG